MSEKRLTVEKLKKLPFRSQMHINGGSEWSGVTKENEEFGLSYGHRTTGSPDYTYTSRGISTADGEVVADLMADDLEVELTRFVQQYNDRATAAV